MHISEGVLSAPVLLSGWGVAVGCTVVGIKKIKDSDIPKVALMSSAFFIASLIHVPFGVTSVHLILNGLIGVLLGWTAFPSILLALFVQAILFQFGGLSSLGVNTVVMALPAIVVYYIFKLALRFKTIEDLNSDDGKNKFKVFWNKNFLYVAGFFCGAFSILLSAILLGFALWMSGDEFILVAKLAVITQIPVMLIEGIITSFCIAFLNKVKPETLGLSKKDE